MGACFEKGKMAIITELLQDSVHNIIHPSSKENAKELSLLLRVKMAKDTAQGIAWLHVLFSLFVSC